MKRVSITLIISFLSVLAFAQQAGEVIEDPAVILSNAQATFDDGKIRNVKTVLEDLLRKSELKQVDLLKAQKTDALRLLTITHLYLEDEQSADDTMLELLQHNHEFEFNDATDPTEFIKLYKTYRTNPIFAVSLGFSTHISIPVVSQTVLRSGLNPNSEYSLLPKFAFGIGWQKDLTEKLTIVPEVRLSLNTLSVEEESLPLSGTTLESGSKNEVLETQIWVEIPLGVRYHLGDFLLRPFVSGGVTPKILATFNFPSDQNNVTIDGTVQPGPITSNADKEDQRNNFQLMPFLGGGIQYKLGEGFLTLEARYSHSLWKVADASAVPVTFETVTPYTYSLSGTELRLGYFLNIYKPEKTNH